MKNRSMMLAGVVLIALVGVIVAIIVIASGRKDLAPETANDGGSPPNRVPINKAGPPSDDKTQPKDNRAPEPQAEKKPETGPSEETKQPQPSPARSIALVPVGWPDEALDALDTVWADVEFDDESLQAVRDGEVLRAALPPDGTEDLPAAVRASVAIFSARLTANFTTTCKRADTASEEPRYDLAWPGDSLGALSFTLAGDTSGLPGGFIGVQVGSPPVLALVPTAGGASRVLVEPGKIRIRKPEDATGRKADVEVDGKHAFRVEVQAGESVPVVLRFGEPPRGQKVRVVDGKGDPVAGVRLKLRDEAARTTGFDSPPSSALGETSIPFPGIKGPTSDVFTAVVASGDVVTSDMELRVAEAQTIDLRVERGAPTELTVVSEAGVPVKFARVTISGSGKNIRRTTDASGHCAFAAFQSGAELKVALPDGVEPLDSGAVNSGESVTIRVKDGASISHDNLIRVFGHAQEGLATGESAPRDIADVMTRELNAMPPEFRQTAEYRTMERLVHALEVMR